MNCKFQFKKRAVKFVRDHNYKNFVRIVYYLILSNF